MPRLKSDNLSVPVLRHFYCWYFKLRFDPVTLTFALWS